MEIKHSSTAKGGEFEAYSGQEKAGSMTYTWAGPDKFIIDHTDVEAAFKGAGVGKEMVLAAVSFAREKGVKIIPLCPFARATFDKHQEIGDVLS